MADLAPIQLSIPCLSDREAAYVQECLATNWISSVGSFVTRFERDFADWVGCAEAGIAVTNGTAALHLALLASGIGPGEHVVVPSLTFIASVNAIHYVGATPVFADSSPATLGLCPDAVRELIAGHYVRRDGSLYHRDTGARLAAIMPVHILGHACDLDALAELAREFGLQIVEDASQGVGTRCRGRHVGTTGRFGCFSFNGNKPLSTGGGGMVVCGDAEDARLVRHLSTQAKADPAAFVHDRVGYNYRLSNLHAAIGVGQLEHLPAMLDRKRAIHARYREVVAGLAGLSLFEPQPWCESNHWLALLQVAPEQRLPVLDRFQQARIEARPFWELGHRQPPYANALRGSLAHAEHLHATGVCLPCHAGMTDADAERVAAVLSSLPR